MAETVKQIEQKGKITSSFLIAAIKFVIKNRSLIKDFLNYSSEYRTFSIRFIKWHHGDSSVELFAYKDSATHYYLKELTTEALQEAIKELDPDLIEKTISLNEEVK